MVDPIAYCFANMSWILNGIVLKMDQNRTYIQHIVNFWRFEDSLDSAIPFLTFQTISKDQKENMFHRLGCYVVSGDSCWPAPSEKPRMILKMRSLLVCILCDVFID